jgi:hypothetical protein
MKKIIQYLNGIVISAIIILTIYALSSNTKQQQAKAGLNGITQLDIPSVLARIENDFNRLVKCTDSSDYVLSYSSSYIRFVLKDTIDNRSDTILYFCGDTYELDGTPNPDDFILYRSVNSEKPSTLNCGIVDFKIRDVETDQDADLGPIHPNKIKLSIQTEAPFPINGDYKRLVFLLTINEKE